MLLELHLAFFVFVFYLETFLQQIQGLKYVGHLPGFLLPIKKVYSCFLICFYPHTSQFFFTLFLFSTIQTCNHDIHQNMFENVRHYIILAEVYTSYSKMAENTLFIGLHVNWPSLPQSHLQNSKESLA